MTKYKLTGFEIQRLKFRGLISRDEYNLLMKTSLLREPNKQARSYFEVPLNKTGSIVLSSINSYGGENFNQPYHFLGEIVHKTTKSVFTRFTNEYKIPQRPFEY